MKLGIAYSGPGLVPVRVIAETIHVGTISIDFEVNRARKSTKGDTD